MKEESLSTGVDTGISVGISAGVRADISTETVSNIPQLQKRDLQDGRYLPVDYALCGKHIVIHYIAGPSTKPTDAFISYTEQKQGKANAPRLLVPLDHVDATPVALAGMLFHSSRCGSTLLCNMLDTLSDCYVVRESGILNKLLSDTHLQAKQKQQLLHAILNSYDRYAQFLGARCVIKFSSHCALHLPYLLAQLPTTPWVYLHRQPEAVVASLIKTPPLWVSSGFIRRVLKLADEKIPNLPAQQAALILQHCFKQVADTYKSQDNGRLLSYPQLITDDAKAATEIANFYGFQPKAEAALYMAACLQVDAKTGGLHQPNSTERQLACSEAEQTCKTFCWSDYECLCDRTQYSTI